MQKERAPNPKLDTFIDWLYEQIEADPTMWCFRS
jgi:LysR family glycine cleavage system transcriptional activator